MHKKSSRYSNLAGGLDSFEYAKIHDDPGHHEKAEEFPANPTSFTNAVRSLQEPVTGGEKWKKKFKKKLLWNIYIILYIDQNTTWNTPRDFSEGAFLHRM